MIHLDTSFLVRLLIRGTSEAAGADSWLQAGNALAISSAAWCEFVCGPVNPADIQRALAMLGTPIPFLAEDANLAAQLFNLAGRRRGSLTDCMIAAVALRAGAEIATSNPADFRRFSTLGLKIR